MVLDLGQQERKGWRYVPCFVNRDTAASCVMGNLLERPVDPNEEEGVLRVPRDLALGACLACLAHGDTLPPDKATAVGGRRASSQGIH